MFPIAQRLFNPETLKPHVTSALRPNISDWSSAVERQEALLL
jgi:hypothetical protein